jgi:hypothetical protein
MRADTLERSLRGLREIQRRRLRGLGGLSSFTTPMIAGGGTYAGTDAGTTGALFAAPARARVPTTAVEETPLMYLLGPLTTSVVPRGAPAALPGRFDPEEGFTGSDPLGEEREVDHVTDAAAEDRAGAGTDVYVPGPDDALDEPRTTSPLWERYKWWALGLLVVLTGAGGWMAWRTSRRRR